MASILAVISKAQFEKLYGKKPSIDGTTFHLDRYSSSQKSLDILAEGGSLFLVTVRPPSERLYLVAVLESPRKEADAWVAARSVVPATDITALLTQLKFETGKGIAARPGALGMSLQTPRRLTEADVALLRSGAPTAKAATAAKAAKATKAAQTSRGAKGRELERRPARSHRPTSSSL